MLISQAILVPEVDHCLLCTMQCRINGTEINGTPRFFTQNSTTTSYSTMIADPMDDVHTYPILLQLEDFVSYFECALHMAAEYKDEEIPHLELMFETLTWDP